MGFGSNGAVVPGPAVHDPGKVSTDLAAALRGYCPADAAMLRAQPELSVPVASGPAVARLVTRLAGGYADGAEGDPRSAGRCPEPGQRMTSRPPGWLWPSSPPPVNAGPRHYPGTVDHPPRP